MPIFTFRLTEIIEKMSKSIENERKHQNLQQKELAYKADMPLPTYKDFIYKKKISFCFLPTPIKLIQSLK